MNKFCKIFLFIAILSFAAYTNPLIEFHLNEVQIDSNGWKIELINLNWQFQSLDSCFLSTIADTAFFKSGISTSDTFLVITQDSLVETLNINPLGDVIGFHYLDNYPIDQISFGNTAGWSVISAPYFYQSICLKEWFTYFNEQKYFYYLDNTPTLGQENDNLNARGYIRGNVIDSMGFAIVHAVVYGTNSYSTTTFSTTCDSNGFFMIHEIAYLAELSFSKQNYQTEYLTVQIQPEDTVTANIILSPVIDNIKMNPDHLTLEYHLSQNFPNPFNNLTTFTYTLPKNDFVEVVIYDLSGKLVEKLFSGQQNPGTYKVHWNAERVASGIYVYQLKSSGYIENKKCLIIK